MKSSQTQFCKYVIAIILDITEAAAVDIIFDIFSHFQCPPCRTFTPKLIETYNKLVGSEKPFEIVFVSSDRSEDGYTDYFKDMPWLALPYGDERVKPLSRLFGVEGKKSVSNSVVNLNAATIPFKFV